MISSLTSSLLTSVSLIAKYLEILQIHYCCWVLIKLLCGQIKYFIISILWEFLRLILWLIMWSIVVNILCALEMLCILQPLGVFIIIWLRQTGWQYYSNFSLNLYWLLGLVILSMIDRGLFKFPTMSVDLFP